MEAHILKKYFAKGNKVTLSGKKYKHGEPLPDRKAGAYDCLVENNMAAFTEEKETFISSANDKTAITPDNIGSFEDAMLDNQMVDISIGKYNRGED